MARNLLLYTKAPKGRADLEYAISEARNIRFTKTYHGDGTLNFSIDRPTRALMNDLGLGYYIACRDTRGTLVFEGKVRSFTPSQDGIDSELLIDVVGFPVTVNEAGPMTDKVYANTTPEAVIADLAAQIPGLKVGTLAATGITGIYYNNPAQLPPPDIYRALDDMCALGTNTKKSIYWKIGKGRVFSTYAVDYTNPVSKYTVSKSDTKGNELRRSLDEVYTSVIVYYKDASGAVYTYTASDSAADNSYSVKLPGDVAYTALKKPLVVNLANNQGGIAPNQAQFIGDALLARVKRVSYKSNSLTIERAYAVTEVGKGNAEAYLVEPGNWFEVTDYNSIDAAVKYADVDNRLFISEMSYDDETGVLTVVPESQASIADYVAKLTREIPRAAEFEKKDALPNSTTAELKNGQTVFLIGDRQYDYNSNVKKWLSRQEFKDVLAFRGGQGLTTQIAESSETPDDHDGIYVDYFYGTFIITGVNDASNYYGLKPQALCTTYTTGTVANYDPAAISLQGVVTGQEYPYKFDVKRAFPKTFTRMITILNPAAGAPTGAYLWAKVKYRLITYPKGLSDGFNRAANVGDPGSADTTQLWAQYRGTPAISADGKLYFSDDLTFYSLVWSTAKTKNYSGSVKIKVTAGYNGATNYRAAAMVVRGVHAKTFCYIQLYNNTLSINTWANDGYTGQLAVTPLTLVDNTEYTLNFTCNENSISASVGAANVAATLSGTNSTIYNAANTELIGLFQYKGGSPAAGFTYFDDLVINPL